MQRKVLAKESLSQPSLDQLSAFAKKWSNQLKGNQLILLKGELGSGKTQFSKFIIAAVGGENVTSPSFAIENQYILANNKLHHFDLYRLENDGEVESSGLWDSFVPNDLVIVEWADRIDFEHWPMDWEILDLSFDLDHSVELTHYAALA